MPPIRPVPLACLAVALALLAGTTPAADGEPPASAAAASTTTTTTTTTVRVLPADAAGSAPAVPVPQPAVEPPANPAAEPPPEPAVEPLPPLAPNERVSTRDEVIRDARDAYARHDRARLAADRGAALAARHPLAEWVDYWELRTRIVEVGPDEAQAFMARWPGTYLEDRFRNDWLLETGRRRDWTSFAREYPRFRMNDDREVACYALLLDHFAGKNVRDAARAAWLAQKDADDGCQLLAQTLHDAAVFDDDDVWRRLRQSAELGRARAARAAAQILGKAAQKDVAELWDNPARFLTRRGGAAGTVQRQNLVTLALARMAASDAGAAALQMNERWQASLGADEAAWTWAVIARQGAQALNPDAFDWQERAWTAWKPRRGGPDRPDWSDEVLAWHARAALRAGTGAQRWRAVIRAVDAMGATERTDATWVYWRAKAQLALASDRAKGLRDPQELEAARAEANAALEGLAGTLGFYGLLAADDLGRTAALPPRPQPPTRQERAAAHGNPGLQRAFALAALELRDEGRREWNYTLRGMSDRELLAAAQWACDQSDWQWCINTSERTKVEIDVAQRYPMPFQRDIAASARENGLEPAFVFGIIRQETRFMPALRSQVGATGLMQLMPATARWVAKKGGFDFRPELIAEPSTNLRLGAFYLKTVLDSFGGSQPMAAAAYNAGPGRPRRWRGGLMVEPAIWIENVPFFETRDYVKKVGANTAIYAALLANRPPQLRPRLGPQIGPRDAEQPTADIP